MSEALTLVNRISHIKMNKDIARSRLFCSKAKRSIEAAIKKFVFSRLKEKFQLIRML